MMVAHLIRSDMENRMSAMSTTLPRSFHAVQPTSACSPALLLRQR